MKKLSFLFAMIFAVSFVFGQNDATVKQGGAAAQDNTATTVQTNGSDNSIYIEQLIENAGATTDPDNTAELTQDGKKNIAKLKQTAGATEAHTLPNYEPYNDADVTQTGNKNKLVGATSNAEVEENTNATQYSAKSYNTLLVNQNGNRNMIGLNQSSGAWNDVTAGIKQEGHDNVLAVYQRSTKGGSGMAQYVESMQSGNDNLARIKQLDDQYSYATVKQYGGLNKLVGADQYGVINENNPATQLADHGGGVSELDVRSDGGNNTVGLYQEGFKSFEHSYTSPGKRTNYANITQNNGSNELGAYQKTTTGWNSLRVTQDGGDEASVCQEGTINNDALIVMGGSGDLALLQSSSGNNFADISMGAGADADISQTGGDDNMIDIEMGAGADADVIQTAGSGGSNWLEGIQSAGSTADVNQSGLNNWASITQ